MSDPGPPTSPLPPAQDLEQTYARLVRIAQKLLSYERDFHTLSASDVVHEALRKLLLAGSLGLRQGPDFVRFVQNASRAMTEVLIDYARTRNAAKRGGGETGHKRLRVEDLDDLEVTIADQPAFDWESLSAAMAELEQTDPRRHQVVLLRFFGGMDNRQIARQLGVDERTVGRDWSVARMWLKFKLTREG